MTTTLTASQTVGSALHSSPAIDAAIRTIRHEVEAKQRELTGARPARAELKETLDRWLKRATEVRGRGPLYPYLGSGVGNGPLVELIDGSVKWDLINGIGVHMFGHGDPELIEASIRGSLSDLIMQGNLQFNADAIEFGEFLANEAARSSRMKHCFITNSGCMANEAALKLCQQKTNAAPRIIAFHDCFMGRSTTMSQIGDTSAYRQGIALNILVDYLPFFDAEMGVQRSIDMTLWHLEQLIHRYPGQHCCLIAELVQGEGGFNTAPREFFVGLFEAAKKAGIPIWDDEVQTFGRTESMFCFERLDLGQYIDVVTIGKISQACACLYTADMNPKAGLLSGTFSASVTSLHAGLSILSRLRDGGYYGANGRIAKLHAAFRAKADDLVKRRGEFFPAVKKPFGRESKNFVSGVGGMMRLTPFAGDKDRIAKLLQHLFEDGVIAFMCGHGPHHLRFLPPIGVMTPADFDPVFEILEKSLQRSA